MTIRGEEGEECVKLTKRNLIGLTSTMMGGASEEILKEILPGYEKLIKQLQKLMTRAETEGPERVVFLLDKWFTQAMQFIDTHGRNSDERLDVIRHLLRNNTILGTRHREVAGAVSKMLHSHAVFGVLPYKISVYRRNIFSTVIDFIKNWDKVLPMMKDLIDLEANGRAGLLNATQQASALIDELLHSIFS